MNCKQIREAIDTASRQNLHSGYVTSHLNGCPDCHRYSDEATSLLGLLSVQPRVEAPPDFEFRLRARMARAQAETASDPRSFLRKLRPQTISWGQMVAAAAVLALIVTVSTFRIDRRNGTPEPSNPVDDMIAVNPQPGGTEPASEIKPSAVKSVGATQIEVTSRSVNVRPSSSRSAVQPSAGPPNDIASIEGSTRSYNPETKRWLKDRSRFYGAETASISPPKPLNIALTF